MLAARVPQYVLVCLAATLQELIVGAAKLGAFGGTFLGGALMLHYGRRLAIGLDGAFFVLGPLLMAASDGPMCGPLPRPPDQRFAHLEILGSNYAYYVMQLLLLPPYASFTTT